MIDRQKMREAAEKATPGEWLYRPRRHDDWGWVSCDGGDLVACARAGIEYDANKHRAAGTDPFGPNALHIVAAQPRNILALLDRLDHVEGLLRRAGEALAPIAKRASRIPGYAQGDELVPAAWPLTNTTIRAASAIAAEIEEALK